MGRELIIRWAGRHHRRPWEDLCADYRRRIGRHLPIRDQPVKVKGQPAEEQRQRREGEELLAGLPDPCWTIALDERGKSLTSRGLADHLGRLLDRWPYPIAFLLGSDLGHGPDFLRACRERLSFGPMTLGHELARLVLYEQIYRSFSIARGIKYHR